MTKILPLPLTFLLFLSIGCQTTQVSKCVEQDWYEIGRRSGASGDLQHNLAKEFSSCSKEERRKATVLYNNGRALGLSQFCQPSNGFELGRRNINTNNVCPERSYKEFNDAYNKGKKLYNLNDENARLKNEAAQLKTENNFQLSEFEKIQRQINKLNIEINQLSKKYKQEALL